MCDMAGDPRLAKRKYASTGYDPKFRTAKVGRRTPGLMNVAMARERPVWVRPGYPQPSSTDFALAAQAVSYARGAGNSIQATGEKHYLDSTMVPEVGISGWTADANHLFQLNAVPQGVTVNTRIGKKWMNKSLQCKGAFKSGTSQTTPSVVRCMLVWDRNPQGVAPVNTHTDMLVSADAFSLSARDNASRFKILRSWSFTMTGNLSGTAGTFTDGSVKEFSFHYNFRKGKYKTECKQADIAGTPGFIIQGGLWFVVLGDSAYTAGGDPTGLLKFRLDFDDA